MKTRHCCQTAKRDRVPKPVSGWRRGAEVAGWLLPSATLVLLPKCPACVAMYVALFSGFGISIAGAGRLRTSLLVLCASALILLALRRLRCMAWHNPFRHRET